MHCIDFIYCSTLVYLRQDKLTEPKNPICNDVEHWENFIILIIYNFAVTEPQYIHNLHISHSFINVN